MAKPAVLTIGMEPAWVDLKSHPEFTPNFVRRYIETQIERLRAMDHDATSRLIEPGETAEATVAVALAGIAAVWPPSATISMCTETLYTSSMILPKEIVDERFAWS